MTDIASGSAPRIVVGLMSGTSLDGISAAVVRFRPGERGLPAVELLAFTVTEYSPAQRARLAAAMRKHPERQILDREVGMGVGAGYPAGARGIMGLVEVIGHGNMAFGKSAQASS